MHKVKESSYIARTVPEKNRIFYLIFKKLYHTEATFTYAAFLYPAVPCVSHGRRPVNKRQARVSEGQKKKQQQQYTTD